MSGGACVGIWAVHHDADEGERWPFHAFLVLSFAAATHVFAATADLALPFRDITAERHCEYDVRRRTVFACTMFAGQGVVQVRRA